MRPVAVPPVRKGDNSKVNLAETRDALKQANKRLSESRSWYDRVRDSFRGQ